ncbi:hypothetical protein K432DRAFT_316088, partial [Lepidopterella palustris CBS 459.81]
YILNLNSRGFAPWLCKIVNIVDKLLAIYSRILVGKNWPKRFVSYMNKLKMAFN